MDEWVIIYWAHISDQSWNILSLRVKYFLGSSSTWIFNTSLRSAVGRPAAVREVACKDNSKYVHILRLAPCTVSQPEASNTFQILYRGTLLTLLKNNSMKNPVEVLCKINERMLNLMVDSVVGQDFSWSFFTFSISSNECKCQKCQLISKNKTFYS